MKIKKIVQFHISLENSNERQAKIFLRRNERYTVDEPPANEQK